MCIMFLYFVIRSGTDYSEGWGWGWGGGQKEYTGPLPGQVPRILINFQYKVNMHVHVCVCVFCGGSPPSPTTHPDPSGWKIDRFQEAPSFPCLSSLYVMCVVGEEKALAHELRIAETYIFKREKCIHPSGTRTQNLWILVCHSCQLRYQGS